MKVYNQETEYELQKWEVNRTPYPQMTGETFWIYRMFSTTSPAAWTRIFSTPTAASTAS